MTGPWTYMETAPAGRSLVARAARTVVSSGMLAVLAVAAGPSSAADADRQNHGSRTTSTKRDVGGGHRPASPAPSPQRSVSPAPPRTATVPSTPRVSIVPSSPVPTQQRPAITQSRPVNPPARAFDGRPRPGAPVPSVAAPRPPAVVVSPPVMPRMVAEDPSSWRRSHPTDRGAVFDRQVPPGTVYVAPGVRRVPPPQYGPPGHPRVIPSLPHNHRVVPFHGTPYYLSGNLWYRPSASGFMLAVPPVGFVTPVLPSYYTRLAIGGVAYYVADDVYYQYTPDGYMVVNPPAMAAGSGYDVPGMPRMYVYPRNGQSAEQLANDRYECHVWAVQQTGFDPTVSGGGVDQTQLGAAQAEYRRAIEACLDARGYTVR